MQEDQRKFPRANMRLMAFIKFLETGKVRRVLTKDISGVGVCFVSNELLEPGTSLEMEVKLPDYDNPITFTAAVVWSRVTEPPAKSYQQPVVETGLKFVAINPKQRSLIVQYAALNAMPPSQT